MQYLYTAIAAALFELGSASSLGIRRHISAEVGQIQRVRMSMLGVRDR